MDDIIVRYKDMPTEIKGMTILDEDGNFNIYINDRLSHDMRLEVYEHELAHIERDDFYRDADIRDKELIGATAYSNEAQIPPVIPEKTPRLKRKPVPPNDRAKSNSWTGQRRTLTEDEWDFLLEGLKKGEFFRYADIIQTQIKHEAIRAGDAYYIPHTIPEVFQRDKRY